MRLILPVIALLCVSSYASAVFVAQSGPNPIVFDQTATSDNLVVLMAAGSEHSEELLAFLPHAHPKHFWIKNFDDTSDVMQWTVSLAAAADYHVEALLHASGGETFELSVVGTGTTLAFSKTITGWDKEAAGVISLPAGTSTIRFVRTSAASNVEIKSLELIRNSDRAAYLQRIADFKADSTVFSQAGYGLMFQYGSWGYPETGPKKSPEDQANDFDVSAFVATVKGTGASYVIWSITWWDYAMNAPIAALDTIVGHGDLTTSRDLIGEVMNALDAEGIDFMLYYHTGHDSHKGYNSTDWWGAQNYPSEFAPRGTGDRTEFFDNWEAVVTAVGNRYGDKLDGWFFDDGVVYYPAPFERLGVAARAGNPNRLICYNPWVATRVTDFQDVMMGEGHKGQNITGSAAAGSNGILTAGPSKGLLQHGMDIMENDWGVNQANYSITTHISAATAISRVDYAKARNVPLSFNLMMWEDGTMSADSLAVLHALRSSQSGITVVLGASAVSGSAPLSVDFDGSASSSGLGITGYTWNFGDGSATETGASATHIYTAIGSYTVTLTVTNSEGVDAVKTAVINVTPVVAGGEISVSTSQWSTFPVVSSTDLAQTQYLSSSAVSTDELGAEHAGLFNGSVGNDDGDTADAGEVTMSSGDSVTIEFDLSVNQHGYDLTGISSYFGWASVSGGRSNQGYSIQVTYADDSSATLAAASHWEPNSPANYWTGVSFAESADGVMAFGVKAVTFTISEAASATGVVVGREIDIFGTPTTSYTAWNQSYPALSNTDFYGDPDNDGLKTGLEYVLNGNPTSMGDAFFPVINATSEDFVFSFTRRVESAEETVQVFQYGSDLSDWNDILITEPVGSEVAFGTPVDGLQTITITISKSQVIADNLFGRLQVTQAP